MSIMNAIAQRADASMKAPPKRKGNPNDHIYYTRVVASLNESPSEKEGKS